MRVLKFTATWCGPCKVLSKELEKIGATVVEIDIEKEPQFAVANNVMALPTLIMFDDKGIEIKRKVGMMAGKQLEEWLKTK